MLPTIGSDTLKILAYAAEVAGRTLGVAAMINLVPDPERRAALEASGNAIAAAVQQTASAYTARLLFEFIDNRIAFGKGRGVDRGFDAAISALSETIRTSLPDRSTANPDYREIFPHGADEYTSPTVKEDDALAADLRKTIEGSKLAVKANLLAHLDALIPIVGPAATAMRDAEKTVNTLFQTELAGRKQIVDTLWEERKKVETALGRSGRGLARFIFFDFRKAPGQGPEGEPPAPETPEEPGAK
jgi:hypothetical protein